MRFLPTCTIGIVAAVALSASAADAQSRHTSNFGGAHAAYESGPTLSEPYNADGPAYNDFQLQGR
jgi:hypothetical protein